MPDDGITGEGSNSDASGESWQVHKSWHGA
jgi:hypothetical protein